MSASGTTKRSAPDVIISSPPSPGLDSSQPKPVASALSTSAMKDDDEEQDALGRVSIELENAIPMENTTSMQNSKDRKGKGRATVDVDEGDLGEYELTRAGEDEAYGDENIAASSNNGKYPPVADDEIEERRVNETLKRWEEQERQRRKALRDSNRTSTSRTSLVEGVSRRASKLFTNPSSISIAGRRTSLRKGATRLRDSEEGDSNPPSRRTSEGTTGGAALSLTTATIREEGRFSPSSPTPLVSNNPFATPRAGSPASFMEREALVQGTSEPPTPAPTSAATATTKEDESYTDGPILRATDSTYSLDRLSPTKEQNTNERPKSDLPPPRPLDLPEEVRVEQMRGTGPMRIERRVGQDERTGQERDEGRWWTDWLCGCREGGKNGEDQAGRTNPFE